MDTKSTYTAIFSITGITTYSPGAVIKSIIGKKETPDEFEKRVWRERITQHDGIVCLPQMAFKYALESGAARFRRKVPGLKGTEYQTLILAGIIPMNPPSLGIKVTDVEYEDLFVPVKGERSIKSKGNVSKRVIRRFPIILPWKTQIRIEVIDRHLDPDFLQEAAKEAGLYIGLGRFRPQVGGFNGRFVLDSFEVG